MKSVQRRGRMNRLNETSSSSSYVYLDARVITIFIEKVCQGYSAARIQCKVLYDFTYA